ncbi:unnamed protein product, partial [marine sediment metagenome]
MIQGDTSQSASTYPTIFLQIEYGYTGPDRSIEDIYIDNNTIIGIGSQTTSNPATSFFNIGIISIMNTQGYGSDFYDMRNIHITNNRITGHGIATMDYQVGIRISKNNAATTNDAINNIVIANNVID